MVDLEAFSVLLYEGAPSEVQQALDSIIYTRIDTSDPANPAELQDSVYLEAIEVDGDDDWDDVTSLGGHLINPASVTLTFSNPDGGEIQSSQTLTGKLNNGIQLTNYCPDQGPTIPNPVDIYNPTPAETQAMRDALQAYYRIGDTFTYTAPVIDGITPTPASYSFVLGASTNVNNKAFVYSETTSGAANGGGELANTGLSLNTVLAVAIAVILASSFGVLRYLKVTK